MRRYLLAIGAALMVAQPVAAQGPRWSEQMTAPAEPGALPLYGAETMGSASSEIWMRVGGNIAVRNVTRPTLTPVLPHPKKATGAAVVVVPGGGLVLLSMDLEGWKVARALADRGIAAFVLKYRTIVTPVPESDYNQFVVRTMTALMRDPTKYPDLGHPAAGDDGIAALRLVRSNATRWRIDPKRVGMIGFSAGAMTALDTALRAGPSEGPDYIGYIYGPQASIAVPAGAPPLFDAIALDDRIFPVMGFPIAQAWRAAKRPVEIHGYERGGHGFGLGGQGTTNALMLDQFAAWMTMHGFLPSPAKSTPK